MSTPPRLHPDTIEDVKQRADIVEVVSEHVVLKKQGKDWVGLCPFHDDRSPSFSVSPAKQFYYCFSCGAGGNSIKFLMELQKTSFSDVVLQLAQRYQVPIKTMEPEQRRELQRQLSLREQLYAILALTARFYQHTLYQPQGRDALDYLHTSRHLTETTLQQFQLGYAPAQWHTLYSYLVEQKQYPVALVEQAGLILPRKGGTGYYDRFRDRLMIPIQDVQGRVIGFGGRTLGGADPKYLNSPETPLFDKGKTLFALDKARGAIAKQDRAVVVEGYFDAISLHAVGIANVVAVLGTALNVAQVKQLLRYTDSKQVVLNFDADAAGTRAVERVIGEAEDLAYRGAVQLRVLHLPEGKDADEFLQVHGLEAYQTLLDQAPLWLDWQIQHLIEGKDLRQADRFQECIQAMVALLGRLPNAALRSYYIHHCADCLSQGNARLALQLEADLRQQVRGQRWHGRSQKWERSPDWGLREAAEAQLLRIYLHCPEYRQLIRATLEERDLEFGFSHHRLLWRQILTLEESSPHENLDLLREVQSNHDPESSSDLQQTYHLLELNELTQLDLSRIPLIVRAATVSLERLMCEKRCRHLLQMWQEASQAAMSDPVQTEQLEALNSKLSQLQKLYYSDSHPLQELDPVLETSPYAEVYRLQQLYYQERQYLEQLQQQRWVTPEDLMAIAT